MRDKETRRPDRKKTDSPPRSEAANLIESETDSAYTDDCEQQSNVDKAITNPSRRLGQVLVWLHLKQRSLTVWLPVIISAVLLIVTWVYARYAKKQWQAMEKQGQTMERSLYISERAYVAIEAVEANLDKGEVTVKLHNVGKSPAGDLKFHAEAMQIIWPEVRHTAGFDSDWGHTQLYPGSLKTVVVMSLQNFTPEHAQRIRGGREQLHISGRIDYWDGFQKSEPHHFAYRYIPPPYNFWMNVPINSFEELQQLK